MAPRRGPLVRRGSLLKSRETALNAVGTFNNSLTTFRAETSTVLMTVASTRAATHPCYVHLLPNSSLT